MAARLVSRRMRCAPIHHQEAIVFDATVKSVDSPQHVTAGEAITLFADQDLQTTRWRDDHDLTRQEGEWLRDTPLLQCEHPAVRVLALRLTQRHHEMSRKAAACFEHVRALPFRFSANSGMMSSSFVIQNGCGDDRSKCTLLIALLRASGIEARVRVLRFFSNPWQGLLDESAHPLSHSLTEVRVAGRWHRIDTYVVDPSLGSAVKSLLTRQGRLFGYGVHLHARCDWDGLSDSLMWTSADSVQESHEDLGCFHDQDHFHRAHPGSARRLPPSAAATANGRIRLLRRTGALQLAG